MTCWHNLLFLIYITTGTTICIVISFRWSSICAFSSVVMFDPLSKLFKSTNEVLMNSNMIITVQFPNMEKTWLFQRWLLTLKHAAALGLFAAAVWSSSFRLREITFMIGICWSLLFSINFLIKMALWQVRQMTSKTT